MTPTAQSDGWADSICSRCAALCCNYITIEVDEPQNQQDLDNFRWYLVHDGISVLVEEGRWFVKADAPCVHLRPDHRCGIYPDRPEACREYDTENCDYHTRYEGWPRAYREFKEFEPFSRYVKGRWARARQKRHKER